MRTSIRQVSTEIALENFRLNDSSLEEDDKLGWTMRIIRAIEGQRTGAIKKSIDAYPLLATLVNNPYSSPIPQRDGLRPIRDHAITLARERAIRQLQALQQDAHSLTPAEAQARRSHIMQTLRRIAPGKATSLQAIQAADGTVSANPQLMADALRTHWSHVFCKRRLYKHTLHQWLQEDLPSDMSPEFPAQSDTCWQVTREDIAQAVERSPNTSPGPDGIPFKTWRTLGHTAITIPHDAYNTLSSEGGEHIMRSDYPDFNHSDMVFLQKSVSGSHSEWGDFCTPEDTRPLNITNSDNRLLANAVRLRMEPILERWISPMQRGVLSGRSNLCNVIDVEEAMMHTALTEKEGAAIFFDFKAAFPSVLHEIILGVLQHIGIPQPLMTFITALYQDNHCSLIIGGTRHQGFQLLGGIRQGCPLSPLCFAITADLLLRRLQRLMPDALLRAYADDLSIIVKNGTSAFPRLINIFNEYAIISGLQLNLPKTVYVPLHTTDLVTWSQEFQRLHPIWHDINIASKVKYLEFILGPGRDHDSYFKPIAKYIQRASDWNTVGCGLALSTMAYNVYILQVRLFVAQLDAPPTTWKQAEAKVLRKLLPGPAHWFKPEALRSISSLGFPKDFPDLIELTKAIQDTG